MAGLPGTGKSTVARQLAAGLPAALLDKDRVRDALFSPDLVEYSTRQDDFCMDVLLETAAYVLRHEAMQHVILDGRTFSRTYQIERVETFATQWQAPVRIIECVCSDDTARRRLSEDAAVGRHRARNRGYDLYLAIQARFQPIREPKLVLDTEQDLDTCVEKCLAYLKPNLIQLAAS
jgi:adenylylsulfate kinase